MGLMYFPSCNFTAASPEAAKRLRAFLAQTMPVAGCCRTDKRELDESTTAVYFCQACRETLSVREQGVPEMQNLFVYLDALEDFDWPDYSALTVNVQDCWRDADHPEVTSAVRSVLGKMGVKVVEPGPAARTFNCFQPTGPELLQAYDCPLVVTACNRCTKEINKMGGKAVHLVELVMGTFA